MIILIEDIARARGAQLLNRGPGRLDQRGQTP
jgi:hypothetical protein